MVACPAFIRSDSRLAPSEGDNVIVRAGLIAVQGIAKLHRLALGQRRRARGEDDRLLVLRVAIFVVVHRCFHREVC